IIPWEEESRLTFLGETSGRPSEDPTLVIDIGGGSTEFVVGRAGDVPDFHVSTQAGSVRQTERHITADPPPPDELTQMAREVGQIIDTEIPRKLRDEVTQGIEGGGTARAVEAIRRVYDHC